MLGEIWEDYFSTIRNWRAFAAAALTRSFPCLHGMSRFQLAWPHFNSDPLQTQSHLQRSGYWICKGCPKVKL